MAAKPLSFTFMKLQKCPGLGRPWLCTQHVHSYEGSATKKVVGGVFEALVQTD